MIYASTVDLEEAYRVGQKAAQIAAEDGSGYMSTILRDPGPIYSVRYDKVPLGGRQLGAHLPQALDRRGPAGRHRRLRALRPAAHRRRLAHHPAGRRPAALCALAADLCHADAARLRAAGGQVGKGCYERDLRGFRILGGLYLHRRAQHTPPRSRSNVSLTGNGLACGAAYPVLRPYMGFDAIARGADGPPLATGAKRWYDRGMGDIGLPATRPKGVAPPMTTHVIETERLILRPMEFADWLPFYECVTAPGVLRYVPEEPYTQEIARGLVERAITDYASAPCRLPERLTAIRKDTGAFVGLMIFEQFNAIARTYELGYVIDPDHHGQGYATEAARALLRYGFETMGLHRIVAICDPRNAASVRVLEKLGMRREAHHVGGVFLHGEWADEVVYAVLDTEWASLARRLQPDGARSPSMRTEIADLGPDHVRQAAALAAERYRILRAHTPHLPARWEDPDLILPMLGELVGQVPGVAALRDGRLVGFLTGFLFSGFRGKDAAYSPEWANGVVVDSGDGLYHDLYTAISARWLGAGAATHLITLPAYDRASLDAWHWMGFGKMSVDAVRDLSPLDAPDPGYAIRRAGLDDAPALAVLRHALWHHLSLPPVYLYDEEYENMADWLADPAHAAWAAMEGDRAVAFIQIQPVPGDVCAAVRDPGTASITGAFVEERARRSGLGAALLDRALAWAREQGYERCGVDFEPDNRQATRFWPRYFRPVCFSLMRHIDERFLSGPPS